MKVCLYGGTFDPPHKGHLAIAQQCLSQFRIDRFLFVPANISPHKTTRKISPVKDRLTMLRLAIRSYSHFEISDLEIDRRGVSYSIDTIIQIKQELQLSREEIFLLIGADSLVEFHSWRKPQTILKEARVIVAARPLYPMTGVPSKFRDHVEILSNPLIDISSSAIRNKINNGEPVHHLLPKAVEDYISQHKLYKS